MLKVKVKGLRETQREIDRARKRLRLTAQEFADLAASVVRDTVTRNAQPFGTGKKAMETGRKAVRGDLLKVFRIVGEGERGRRGVIGSKAEAKRWHRSRRNNSGRTTRGQRRKIVESIFRAYMEEVQARVGMAKGSVTGGDDTRLKGRVPRWVREWKGTGDASRRRKIGGAVWTFRAEPKHVASPRVLGERGVRRVQRQQERNLARVLKRKVAREMRKAQRRANGR